MQPCPWHSTLSTRLSRILTSVAHRTLNGGASLFRGLPTEPLPVLEHIIYYSTATLVQAGDM